MERTSLTTRVSAILTQLDQELAKTGSALEQESDNPAVNRDTHRGRSFTVASSELFRTGNWTPFYHDWPAQYRHAKELLLAKSFHKLRELLAGKTVDNHRFAPEVCSRIQAHVGDLDLIALR